VAPGPGRPLPGAGAGEEAPSGETAEAPPGGRVGGRGAFAPMSGQGRGVAWSARVPGYPPRGPASGEAAAGRQGTVFTKHRGPAPPPAFLSRRRTGAVPGGPARLCTRKALVGDSWCKRGSAPRVDPGVAAGQVPPGTARNHGGPTPHIPPSRGRGATHATTVTVRLPTQRVYGPLKVVAIGWTPGVASRCRPVRCVRPRRSTVCGGGLLGVRSPFGGVLAPSPRPLSQTESGCLLGLVVIPRHEAVEDGATPPSAALHDNPFLVQSRSALSARS